MRFNKISSCYSGGLTAIQLEGRIEKWVYEVTGTKIEFESLEARNLLKNFGILSEIDDRLHVLPLMASLNNLPQQPQSVVARATESDIYEGYDRDTFIETEEQYQEEDKVQKRIGWF